MKKTGKAAFVMETLDRLYPKPSIPLVHKDPYTLLVSVLLSAQCTDERVNRITPALFQLADNPKEMVRLKPQKILDVIRPCGLGPAKSKNIHALSVQLLEKYGGEVPRDIQALEALPGVGHKTASVVMVQAFGKSAFPVDTHIHRLMYRWGLSDGSNVVRTERDAKQLFPESRWGRLHLQIIYFGREYCPARGHLPGQCPICSVVGRKSLLKGP